MLFNRTHWELTKGRWFSTNNHRKEMMDLWQKHYGVKIISNNSRFEQLGFANESDYIMFIMKWS
jgi:hypothetical protein